MGLWAFPLPAACDAGDDHGRAGDSSRDSGLRLQGQGLRSKVKRFKPQAFRFGMSFQGLRFKVLALSVSSPKQRGTTASMGRPRTWLGAKWKQVFD